MIVYFVQRRRQSIILILLSSRKLLLQYCALDIFIRSKIPRNIIKTRFIPIGSTSEGRSTHRSFLFAWNINSTRSFRVHVRPKLNCSSASRAAVDRKRRTPITKRFRVVLNRTLSCGSWVRIRYPCGVAKNNNQRDRCSFRFRNRNDCWRVYIMRQ